MTLEVYQDRIVRDSEDGELIIRLTYCDGSRVWASLPHRWMIGVAELMQPVGPHEPGEFVAYDVEGVILGNTEPIRPGEAGRSIDRTADEKNAARPEHHSGGEPGPGQDTGTVLVDLTEQDGG